MRRFHLALLVVALFTIVGARAQGTPPAAQTVEELGRDIFAALQSGSFEDMEHLLPTEADIIELIDKEAAAQTDVSEERLEEIRSQVPEIVAATREKLVAEFSDVRERYGRGIDWSAATLRGVRITVRDPETYEEREVDEATLMAEQRVAADVQILFEAAGDSREIDLQDCAKSSRGWLVVETLSLPK